MKVQKQRKSRSNLCEYFDKTKEEMREIIAKLPKEDRKFLQDLYGSDYSKIIPRGTKIDKNRQIKIFDHIDQLLEKSEVKTRKSRSNLCEYFEKTKEEMQEIISKLPKEEQKFLQDIYGYDYSRIVPQGTKINDKRRTTIFDHIEKVLNSSQLKTYKIYKSRNNLCGYFEKTKEEMQEIISKLPKEDRKFLQDLYGSDYSKIIPRGTKIDKNRQIKIFDHIDQLLEKSEVKTRKSRSNLCDYFEKTKEEMQEIISKLPKEDRKFLQDLYGSDYSKIIPQEIKIDKTRRIKIFDHIDQLLEKSEVKTRKSRSDLCGYFEKTKEEMQEIISKLPKEDKEFLQDLYGSDYSKIIPRGTKIDKNRQIKIFDHIDQLLEKSEVKTRKSRSNLCEYFEKTKEEMQEIISKLPKEDRKFLQELYDTNYSKFIREENELDDNNLVVIFYHIDQVLKNRQVKTRKSRSDLCGYFEKTKEEMDQIALQLSKEDLELLQEFYDKDYKRIISKEITSQQKNHLYYSLKCIIQGKSVKTESTQQPQDKEESYVEEGLTKEDFEDLSKMINQNTMEKQAKKMSIEESIIFILRNKIYDSKEFSVEAISEFLQEDPKVIKKIEKRALMTFKQQLASLNSELKENECPKTFSLKG